MGRYKGDRKHISKIDFVRELAKRSGYNQADVLAVVDCIDDTLIYLLSDATDKTSVEVNMTHDIRIENYYTIAKKRYNPIKKETWISPAHFRTRAVFAGEMKRIGG